MNKVKRNLNNFLMFLGVINLLLCTISIAQQPKDKKIEPYVTFLKNDHPNPVDYIMQLFDKYDMVVICERVHTESTQWDFIFELISDKRFIEQVGNVFTEYGVATLQPFLNDFMNTNDLTDSEIEEKVVHIMRNLMIVWPMWSNTNFYNYLKKLYILNQSLPQSNRINHYFSDIPCDWEGMTQAKYDSIKQNLFPIRDKIMADRIEKKFKKILDADVERKKCLVIMNYRHAFGPIRDSNGKLQGNTCEYLFEAFPGRTANVLLNTVGFDLEQNFVRISDGKWDAAFKAVGDSAVGFDFADSPFGKDPFDMFPWRSWIEENYKYQDVFTGFIFYQPLNKHLLEEGFPGLFDGFEDIVLSRAKFLGDDFYKKLKKLIRRFNKVPIMSRKAPYGRDY